MGRLLMGRRRPVRRRLRCAAAERQHRDCRPHRRDAQAREIRSHGSTLGPTRVMITYVAGAGEVGSNVVEARAPTDVRYAGPSWWP